MPEDQNDAVLQKKMEHAVDALISMIEDSRNDPKKRTYVRQAIAGIFKKELILALSELSTAGRKQ